MKRKTIVFDFEVFKHDTLLGAIELSKDGRKLFQLWNLDEITEFYRSHRDDIWVGHNNSAYDNFILDAIVNKENPKAVSDQLISGNRRKFLRIPLIYYDIMSQHFSSLKAIEACVGKNISETSVSFDIDRKLTEEERKLTERYNYDDLDQTLDDLILVKDELSLKIEMMKEFNLGWDTIHITGTKIAEKVLLAKPIDGIERMRIEPKIPDNMMVKNQMARDYFLKEMWRDVKKIKLNLCGVDHYMGLGGIHAARKGYHSDWAFYFDVSGYYNLVMINYDLLPRTVPEEGKNKYIHMYHEQLRLKKINPMKRKVYKPILLAVFGAELSEYSKFYDPSKGRLVTLTGQMFLIDLLEKMEGKIELIQSNTDGIIAKPLPGVTEEDMLAIIHEWEERTGFNLKLDKIYDIYQRDVNNYMYRDDKGNIHVKGEAVKYYNLWENPFVEDSMNSAEPYIIHHCIVEHFMNGKSPEQTIEENKENLRMFQFIVKKLSFDRMVYEETHISGHKREIELQNVNRAFSMRDKLTCGKIFKIKGNKRNKAPNMPDSVFIYNEDIRSPETCRKLSPKIDYSYYAKRAREKIEKFMPSAEQLNLFDFM